MPIDNDKPDKIDSKRTSTEPHGVFGEPSPDRPIVSEQRSDPTHGHTPKAGTEGAARAANKAKGSRRSDEEMQRGSESGTSRVADEKRASDDVDEEGHVKR